MMSAGRLKVSSSRALAAAIDPGAGSTSSSYSMQHEGTCLSSSMGCFTGRSLVLHEEAQVARLEHYRKKNIMVDTVLHGEVASSCAYWVPLEDWRGETIYLNAWGVDDILDSGEMGTP